MIKFEIDSHQVTEALEKLTNRVDNMRPVFDDIGAMLVSNIDFCFRDSQSPWGEPWDELKQRQGKPLMDSGLLRQSITHRADSHSVEIGTNKDYAPTHQFGAAKGKYGKTKRGAPIPWGNIPARPFLPIHDDAVDLPSDWEMAILNAIQGYLEK